MLGQKFKLSIVMRILLTGLRASGGIYTLRCSLKISADVWQGDSIDVPNVGKKADVIFLPGEDRPLPTLLLTKSVDALYRCLCSPNVRVFTSSSQAELDNGKSKLAAEKF